MTKQTEEVSKDTALRMAIEIMERLHQPNGNSVQLAIQACKEALENLEKDPPISRKKLAETKEPVAFLSADTKAVITRAMRSIRAEDEMDGKVIKDFPTPLYITPPSREWVGLSDEEISGVWNSLTDTQFYFEFGRAVEAKLREKNNGT